MHVTCFNILKRYNDKLNESKSAFQDGMRGMANCCCSNIDTTADAGSQRQNEDGWFVTATS